MITIEELLKDYEHKLNEIYARANTKSKRKRIVNDLITFSNICSEHFGVDKEFEWERDLKIISLLKNYRVPFIQNIVKNTELFYNIFTSVLNSFIEGSYSIYNYYGKEYRRLTERELEELILEFLNSYDPALQKDFCDKLEHAELFYSDLHGYAGLTYPIGCLNKNLIFFNSDLWRNINDISVIAHEYGHCFEMKNFYMTGRGNYLDVIYVKPFYEISSRFFEYAFLKFLQENNVYNDDVMKCLNTYLFDLLIRTYNIVLLYSMSELSIDELDNAYILDDSFMDKAKVIQEKINYYSLPFKKGDVIKYRYSFLYGIGDLFSIYLYENYKEDSHNFKKEFRNALLAYPYCDDTSSFERVGITHELLIEGDALKRVLRNSR